MRKSGTNCWKCDATRNYKTENTVGGNEHTFQSVVDASINFIKVNHSQAQKCVLSVVRLCRCESKRESKSMGRGGGVGDSSKTPI